MELHDYLGHGRRVLSHPDHDDRLQLLDECLDVTLPGLDPDKLRALKLDGTKDEALYRDLLLANSKSRYSASSFVPSSFNARSLSGSSPGNVTSRHSSSNCKRSSWSG